jgi:hypothetical protein
MALDDKQLLGCVYIDPPHTAQTDADVWYWARQSELAGRLEDTLQAFIVDWLAREWPFARITLNGAVTSLDRLPPDPAG